MSSSSDDESWFEPVGPKATQTLVEFKHKKYQVSLPPLTTADEKAALVSILLQLRISKDCEEALQMVYKPASEQHRFAIEEASKLVSKQKKGEVIKMTCGPIKDSPVLFEEKKETLNRAQRRSK